MKGVLKRGDNYIIDYRDGNRRRHRQLIGPCKKLAEAALRKIKTEIAEGKYLDVRKHENILFKDFAQEFLELHSKPHNRSWRSGAQSCLSRLTPFFGNCYLHEITPALIAQYKSERLKTVIWTSDDGQHTRTVKPSTINRELTTLKCALNRAVAWGKLKENPATKVKLFRENNQRVRYLEKEELKCLLGHCSPRLAAVVLFAVNTGMRKGEIQNLKWRDVNYERGLITLTETKNGEIRYVPINEIVRNVLISTPKHPESPYIFHHAQGKDPYNFRKAFATALGKAGIKDFRFHDLRHTFGSHLVMAGSDLNTVRELLGHKDLKMTLRYAHLSQDHKARAVALLQREIGAFGTLGAISREASPKANTVMH